MCLKKNLATIAGSIHISKSSWKEIQEYKEDYKEVIRIRDGYRPPFLHQSPQMHYRKEAVNHINRVAVEKKLTYCSVQLAVYILDIFMDNHMIAVDLILLVANICLLIAVKIEENAETTPKIMELNSFVNNKYTRLQYKDLEIRILNFFNWYVIFQTPAHYTHYYIQEIVNYEDVQKTKSNLSVLLCDIFVLVKKYLDRVVEDVHYMQGFVPSILAAAVLSSARVSIGLSSWTVGLQSLTDYTDEDIKDIREMLLQTKPLVCTFCCHKE